MFRVLCFNGVFSSTFSNLVPPEHPGGMAERLLHRCQHQRSGRVGLRHVWWRNGPALGCPHRLLSLRPTCTTSWSVPPGPDQSGGHFSYWSGKCRETGVQSHYRTILRQKKTNKKNNKVHFQLGRNTSRQRTLSQYAVRLFCTRC